MPLIIELPDNLVALLARHPHAGEDLNAFAIAALWDLAEAGNATEPDPEVVAAGLEAIEDAQAGRLLTLEQVDEHFEAALAERREQRERERGLRAA